MNRGKDIIAYHTFAEHNSVLIVVTLPRHVCNKQVTSESKLTIFSSVSFCKYITGFHTLTLVTDRTQVDCHILVCTTELRNAIFL